MNIRRLFSILFLSLFFLSASFGYAQGQQMTTGKIQKQLKGTWKVSVELSWDWHAVCSKCDSARFNQDLDLLSSASVTFINGKKANFRVAGIEGIQTYSIGAEWKDHPPCPELESRGTFHKITFYEETQPGGHGDTMTFVFLDKDTLWLMDTGCPTVLVRQSK